MAKRKQTTERELSKDTMSRLWGYADILKTDYQDRSYKVLSNKTMDGERKKRLAADLLSKAAELDDLQKELTRAIDACGDDDDDD